MKVEVGFRIPRSVRTWDLTCLDHAWRLHLCLARQTTVQSLTMSDAQPCGHLRFEACHVLSWRILHIKTLNSTTLPLPRALKSILPNQKNIYPPSCLLPLWLLRNIKEIGFLFNVCRFSGLFQTQNIKSKYWNSDVCSSAGTSSKSKIAIVDITCLILWPSSLSELRCRACMSAHLLPLHSIRVHRAA